MGDRSADCIRDVPLNPESLALIIKAVYGSNVDNQDIQLHVSSVLNQANVLNLTI